ncbi:MAG: tetratricopeptide repeat protein [Melioribacteraceae bacterium]|nr:tetratricopeptide repeat protein [Melioribacteraceae bacterium]
MDTAQTVPKKSKIVIDHFGYNVEGVSKADLGQFSEALYYFDKAIEEDPQDYVAYFNRASIKMRLGDIEGARKDFKESELLDISESM